MEKKEKESIEIPFGASDSELCGWEYTIPEGMEAEIKDGKVIVRKKESEDERIRKDLICEVQSLEGIPQSKREKYVAWLEKQKERTRNIIANLLDDGITGVQRELIEFLSNNIDASLVDVIKSSDAYAQRIRSMFEKQKEQKPLMYDGEIEDTKRDIVAAIRKYYPADYAEYLTSFLKGLSPEDNSEDEYGQEMLGIAYKLMYEHIPENLRTQEFWNSLKFMREYTGRVAIIHFYEKPAE